MAIAAMGAPVRWIFSQAPASKPQEREGDENGAQVVAPDISDVYDDPRMVRFENGVVFLACVNAVLVILAAVASQLPKPDTSPDDRARCRGHRRLHRLGGRHDVRLEGTDQGYTSGVSSHVEGRPRKLIREQKWGEHLRNEPALLPRLGPETRGEDNNGYVLQA
jgi:hypothetical protein